jgi:hypothetical protein
MQSVVNEHDKVLLKCAEELNELSVRLLQQVNKKKDYTKSIKREIKDVQNQLKMLMQFYET